MVIKICASPTLLDHSMTNVLMFGHYFNCIYFIFQHRVWEYLQPKQRQQEHARMIIPGRDRKLESHFCKLLYIYRNLSHAVFGRVHGPSKKSIDGCEILSLIFLPGCRVLQWWSPRKDDYNQWFEMSWGKRGCNLPFDLAVWGRTTCLLCATASLRNGTLFPFWHLAVQPTLLWCGTVTQQDASRLNRSRPGLLVHMCPFAGCSILQGQTCQSMPVLAVGRWVLVLTEKIAWTCRWVNSRNFHSDVTKLHDVAWCCIMLHVIQFSHPAATSLIFLRVVTVGVMTQP